MKRLVFLAIGALLSVNALATELKNNGEMPQKDQAMITYRTVNVQGLSIFYREAGSGDAPTVLLLHGFPSSSRMFDKLIPVLAKQYHVIAPDYPGFGHSDAPPAETFTYTFDHLASIMDAFAQELGIHHYALFVQDYGGPVGFRLALMHPDRIDAIVVQNAVAHEEGLGPLWVTRRQYWANREVYADKLRANLISFDAAKQRHVGTDPHPELYDPDLWTDESAFLSRPGEDRIQEDLFYDYRTNVAAYPKWQSYLKTYHPPLLVVWGKYDPSFTVAGAWAYKRDVPDAEIHILDAGHFAMDTKGQQVADLTMQFLDRQHTRMMHVQGNTP
ncbi:alpha/beta fold hydrolase [Dyella humi]|uniref:Alpha/beta hydrolase n=1 Tax=Dyella humi TaxID=1770547 RepID=A0ABW8IHV4_9GAMM